MSRYSVEIIPDNPTDEAFIEEVLGLREDGQSVALTRINAMGLSCVAYLRAEKVAEAPAAPDASGQAGQK